MNNNDNHSAVAVTTTEAPDESRPGDIAWDKDVRINVLVVEVIVGLIGCILVCLWMYYNRRRKSRVNNIILNLTAADFLVLLFSAMGQIIWEYLDSVWYAGNFGCKVFKMFQTFAMTASTFILMVIAVDRHQAIRAPLKEPFAVSASSNIAVFNWGDISDFREEHSTHAAMKKIQTFLHSNNAF